MWELAKQLRRHAFGESDKTGFLIDKARETFVDARFVEEISYEETIYDPRGPEWVYNRTTFTTIHFRCSAVSPELLIYDAPRSTRTFFNALSKVCNFEVSFEPVQVNVLDWIDSVEAKTKATLYCSGLKTLSFEFTDTSKAAVEISSEEDARTDLASITGNRKVGVERAHIVLQSVLNSSEISISKDGTIRLIRGEDDAVALALTAIPFSIRESQ